MAYIDAYPNLTNVSRGGSPNNALSSSAPVQASSGTPQTIEEILQAMLTSQNPIKQAAGIQGQTLQDAIPMFSPYQEGGLQAYEQLQQGSTAGGLDQILAEIMGGDSFNALQDRRGEEITNMLSAGGLTRSGETIQQGADLTIDNALSLYDLLRGNQGGLAETGYRATTDVAGLTTDVGAAIASGILGNEASKNARDAQQDTNRSNLFGSLIGGVGALGAANIFKTGSLFGGSDPSLKTNVRKFDKIGPLNVYEWDWIPETKGTIIEGMPRRGFMSPEVREHYPDRVKTFGGFDMIDYGNLIEDLKCQYKNAL